MRRVVWTAGAIRDLRGIEDYVARDNKPAAARLAARIRLQAVGLGTASERGRLIAPGIRQVAALNPYLIRYRVTDDDVVVLQIWHAARQPR